MKKSMTIEQELDNAVGKFVVKVAKNNESVGHLPPVGKICKEVIGCRRHCKQFCGGMEIPLFWCFICLIKVKINLLKKLLESKLR